jgi:hypothetical protein
MEKKMKPISKMIAASAAALSTFALVVIAAPAVHADEYCITNGAQAAHGCGYPSMEVCRAASSGIGGMCSSLYKAPSDALAYHPKQPHLRSERHPAKKPAGVE